MMVRANRRHLNAALAAMWASLPVPVPGTPVPEGPWRGVARATVNGLHACAEHGPGADVTRELGVPRLLADAEALTGFTYDRHDPASWLLAADDVEALLPPGA